MEVKRFTKPSPDYVDLVRRLYGDQIAQRLSERYQRWLGSDRQYAKRLRWLGIGIYDDEALAGHLIVQTPHSGKPPFLGFFEAVNDQEVAHKLMAVAVENIAKQQRLSVLAPVDLSMWHSQRFTVSEGQNRPFQGPQQPYYQVLFGSYFRNQLVYHSYQWTIPNHVSAPPTIAGVVVRVPRLTPGSPDWAGLYAVTQEAFFDAPIQPTLEEFIELFSDEGGEQNHVLVAESEGEIIGYCFYRMTDHALAIKTLAIRPPWQGRGIGRLLHQSVMHEANTIGCHQAYFLNLRSDRLIEKLRPKDCLVVSTSILYHTLIV